MSEEKNAIEGALEFTNELAAIVIEENKALREQHRQMEGALQQIRAWTHNLPKADDLDEVIEEAAQAVSLIDKILGAAIETGSEASEKSNRENLED